jgi:hypothetical protein
MRLIAAPLALRLEHYVSQFTELRKASRLHNVFSEYLRKNADSVDQFRELGVWLYDCVHTRDPLQSRTNKSAIYY